MSSNQRPGRSQYFTGSSFPGLLPDGIRSTKIKCKYKRWLNSSKTEAYENVQKSWKNILWVNTGWWAGQHHNQALFSEIKNTFFHRFSFFAKLNKPLVLQTLNRFVVFKFSANILCYNIWQSQELILICKEIRSENQRSPAWDLDSSSWQGDLNTSFLSANRRSWICTIVALKIHECWN